MNNSLSLKICSSCHFTGPALYPGSGLLELFLWILFPLGPFYSVWRRGMNARNKCPECGARTMIPVHYGRGKELALKYSSEQGLESRAKALSFSGTAKEFLLLEGDYPVQTFSFRSKKEIKLKRKTWFLYTIFNLRRSIDTIETIAEDEHWCRFKITFKNGKAITCESPPEGLHKIKEQHEIGGPKWRGKGIVNGGFLYWILLGIPVFIVLNVIIGAILWEVIPGKPGSDLPATEIEVQEDNQ